jgi:hypothetical protein
MMNRTLLISLATSAAAFTILLLVAIRYVRAHRKARRTTWEALMKRLVPVDEKAIERIALDAVDASGGHKTAEHPRELGRKDIWRLLNGMDGINRIDNNARVIVEMAAYLERWHPEASETAEGLRLEARSLEWHVGRLRDAEISDCLDFHFHSYGQRAALSYYTMLKSVLALAQQNKGPLFTEIRREFGALVN